MAILKIARLGHPILREVSLPIDPADLASDAVQGFIDDLIETMRDADGAGLAAPQVHVPQRIALIEVDGNPRYPEFPQIPLTVLVNPEITFLTDDTVKIWEGCLSVPGLRGQVPRRRHIHVKALDRHGGAIDFEAEDGFAGIVQHECDHLDGLLFVDKLLSSRSLSFLPEFQRYRADEPLVSA
jgi:peptide deformylase